LADLEGEKQREIRTQTIQAQSDKHFTRKPHTAHERIRWKSNKKTKNRMNIMNTWDAIATRNARYLQEHQE